MKSTVSNYVDWRDFEEDIAHHVLGNLSQSNFFMNYPGSYLKIKPRTVSERERREMFIRYEVTTIHGETVCTVEKVIESVGAAVMVRHRNSHPARCGKIEETHTTTHIPVLMVPQVPIPYGLLDALTESVLATMSALCRLRNTT